MVGQNVGKYRVQDRIGRGGMGTVYRATDETLHREVAIKVLNAELNDPEVAKRFRAEAITVARLSHPGIATIYELFQHDGQWLMVMEFVRGETLEHLVSRMGQLSPQRAAEVCMHALAALAHAHSMGVVHRDLKPANMMITETGAVKVMDFGIARVAGTEHLTNAGFMMGTPAYMAPEQVRGGEIDARADLYAMGVVFYRLTTGQLPFKGDTPFALVQSQVYDQPTPVGLLRADLPPWVEVIITRALAKAPEERFQSAVEFHEALARSLAGLPLTTLYGAAPADLIATPPRPMPTGAFSPTLTPSGAIPRPTGATPMGTPMGTRIAADQDVTMAAPGTQPTLAVSGSDAPTALTPQSRSAAAGLTGAMTGSEATGAMAAGASTHMQAQPPASLPSSAGASGAPRKKSGSGLLIGAAVIVIAGVIGGAMWLRGPSTPPAETPSAESTDLTAPQPGTGEPPADAAAAADATPPPAVPVERGSTPPPAPAPPKPAPGRTGAGAPAASGDPGAAQKPAGATSTTAPAGAPAAPPPVRAADDALVTFNDVKLYVVNGKKTNDQDVIVNFASGQVAVMPKSGGSAIVTIPYRRIAKATYIKARDPKWDESLAAPPADLDVGSFMRQSRHWLVIQTRDAFEILRLDDKNVVQVLDTLEKRTGIRVERLKSTDK